MFPVAVLPSGNILTTKKMYSLDLPVKIGQYNALTF